MLTEKETYSRPQGDLGLHCGAGPVLGKPSSPERDRGRAFRLCCFRPRATSSGLDDTVRGLLRVRLSSYQKDMECLLRIWRSYRQLRGPITFSPFSTQAFTLLSFLGYASYLSRQRSSKVNAFSRRAGKRVDFHPSAVIIVHSTAITSTDTCHIFARRKTRSPMALAFAAPRDQLAEGGNCQYPTPAHQRF